MVVLVQDRNRGRREVIYMAKPTQGQILDTIQPIINDSNLTNSNILDIIQLIVNDSNLTNSNKVKKVQEILEFDTED